MQAILAEHNAMRWLNGLDWSGPLMTVGETAEPKNRHLAELNTLVALV